MLNTGFTIQEYPDYVNAGGLTKLKSKNLGEKFAMLNSFFFDYLKEFHIPIGYVKQNDKNSLKFIRLNKLPVVVKILNSADKRTAGIFNIEEGTLLNLPIYEYYLSADQDNLINETHLVTFNLCSIEDIKAINRLCSKVNAVLRSFFERRNLLLLEVTVCFGKKDNKIFIIDDFTPKSLKVIPLDIQNRVVDLDPYKINTSLKLRKYTDFLINLLSN